MVLKGVNWGNNIKFRSYGFEMDQLGTICKTIIFKVSWGKLRLEKYKLTYFPIPTDSLLTVPIKVLKLNGTSH